MREPTFTTALACHESVLLHETLLQLVLQNRHLAERHHPTTVEHLVVRQWSAILEMPLRGISTTRPNSDLLRQVGVTDLYRSYPSHITTQQISAPMV